MPLFVEVALPIPLFRNFTYSVPEEFQSQDLLGTRACVPFGKRMTTGVIVGVSEESSLEKTRDLLDVIDDTALFTPQMLQFAHWMSEYYVASLGETLRAMLPQGTTPETSETVELAHSEAALEAATLARTAPRQAAILRALSDHPDGVTIRYLQKKVGANSLYSQLNALEARGLITRTSKKGGLKPKIVRSVRINPELLRHPSALKELFDQLDNSAPKQAALFSLLYSATERDGNILRPVPEMLKASGASSSALNSLVERGVLLVENVEVTRERMPLASLEVENYSSLIEEHRELILNEKQDLAVRSVVDMMASGEFATFLLHGVTGSGKTQVYIEAIRWAVSHGKTAILLVPEIALTLQLVERFIAVFGDRVAVLHSRLSDGERFDTWRRVAAGGCDVVIGARSALFAPLRNIGIIVVDEEHEASYKQFDQQPRYHARDAAIVRAQLEGAVTLLGSATPSLESYYNAEKGKYTLLELPERVDNAKEPAIVIIDTLEQKNMRLMRGSLSVRLLNDIRERIAQKQGVILFQNRRGFSSRLECSACSHSPMCPHCAVTLTLHKTKDELRCHYCGYVRRAEKVCEICGNADLRQPGVGTQRVEEELHEHLPEARVMRMDLDTTSRKGAHRRILSSFANGEADILLGTQMVAKGLDFSRVALVGVISADTQLLLPDFRASERTYQLLTQVAGRAGRRENMKGEVVIQTNRPDHPAIQAAFSKDYQMMYERELSARRELRYPPFTRFIVIEIRSENQRECEMHARQFRELLPANEPALEILGPTAALIWKLRNQYRYQIVIKNNRALDPAGKLFARLFRKAYHTYREKHAKNSVHVSVDVDAQGMM